MDLKPLTFLVETQFEQFLPNWAVRAVLSLGLLSGDTAMSAPGHLKLSCLPGAFVTCAGGWNGLVEVQQPCFGWFCWEVSTVKLLQRCFPRWGQPGG